MFEGFIGDSGGPSTRRTHWARGAGGRIWCGFCTSVRPPFGWQYGGLDVNMGSFMRACFFIGFFSFQPGGMEETGGVGWLLVLFVLFWGV